VCIDHCARVLGSAGGCQREPPQRQELAVAGSPLIHFVQHLQGGGGIPQTLVRLREMEVADPRVRTDCDRSLGELEARREITGNVIDVRAVIAV